MYVSDSVTELMNCIPYFLTKSLYIYGAREKWITQYALFFASDNLIYTTAL